MLAHACIYRHARRSTFLCVRMTARRGRWWLRVRPWVFGRGGGWIWWVSQRVRILRSPCSRPWKCTLDSACTIISFSNSVFTTITWASKWTTIFITHSAGHERCGAWRIIWEGISLRVHKCRHRVNMTSLKKVKPSRWNVSLALNCNDSKRDEPLWSRKSSSCLIFLIIIF